MNIQHRPPSTDLLSRFAKIVGDKYAITDPQAQLPYLTEMRDLYRGRTPMVLRPGSVEEVSRIVALANEAGTGIVPQGGNTGLVGGQLPFHDEILLSLNRLDRIREVDAASNTITCEAGVTLGRAREAAAAVDRLYPQLLPSEGTCTIGGNLSTNAGGTAALAYGIARSHALGIEVVLADGRVLNNLNKLKKDNTGYDLKNLFIGAEGTLGIITAAVLRLYPRPTATATAWLALATPRNAVELLAALRTHVGDRVSAFELVSRECLDAVLAHRPDTRDPLREKTPWYVLAEFADSGPTETLRERVAQALESHDAVLAQSDEQSRQLWRIRESIPEAQFTNVKHDVSVPVSRTPELIERAGAALHAAFPQARPYVFGHVGDGNLHYNVGPETLLARRAEVNRIVYHAVAELGGSISAEHGLGQLKRDDIRH
ncbi:MAG: FAD-binding oxidoreductase, partial [Xanthobacteraceae bacterium]